MITIIIPEVFLDSNYGAVTSFCATTSRRLRTAGEHHIAQVAILQNDDFWSE